MNVTLCKWQESTPREESSSRWSRRKAELSLGDGRYLETCAHWYKIPGCSEQNWLRHQAPGWSHGPRIIAAFQALWCQQMLCGHSAQPHVLMQAFVVKILPWWRTGSSDALEREEKIFFLEPNRKVFFSHCLLCMLDSGIHLWHKYLRRSYSANYRNLPKCRPFPLRKVAFGDDCLSWDASLGKLYYCATITTDVWNTGTDLSPVAVIETAAWVGTGMLFCQRLGELGMKNWLLKVGGMKNRRLTQMLNEVIFVLRTVCFSSCFNSLGLPSQVFICEHHN